MSMEKCGGASQAGLHSQQVAPMPRPPRPDLADVPQHVIQRGNDRQACFFRDDDYRTYLALLREAALRNGCRVHAYVLMTNHVHLLVTPAQAGGVSRMMQTLGRNYVGHVNGTYRRTGTLWEGRFKSCLVDSEYYVLACYRYIELNPVRAGMTALPADYPWSSHRSNSSGQYDALVQPHPSYLALASVSGSASQGYVDLFADEMTAERLVEIRAYVQQQKALGGARFQAQIEVALGRQGQVRPAHRPARDR